MSYHQVVNLMRAVFECLHEEDAYVFFFLKKKEENMFEKPIDLRLFTIDLSSLLR